MPAKGRHILNNALYVAIFFILSFFIFSFVNADTGTIDTSATNQAKVCHNSLCSSYGIINFELASEPPIVVDSDTGITGNVWGNELGWINFHPTGAGVTFANSTTGVLQGFAWSQVSGWINFSPTNEGVTINPSTGELEGYAWSGGAYGGWIKFDCGDSSTCVKTTWHPNSGCLGGCGGPPDICKNIPGKQTEVPVGYEQIGNSCFPIVDPIGDVCPNEPDFQFFVPLGEHIDVYGNCVPDIDVCPNILGNQTSIPPGKHLDGNGQCVDTIINTGDGCPSGTHLVGTQCITDDIDLCPNIPSVQTSVPSGKEIVEGQCVDVLNPDFCPNIPESQATVPVGMHIEGGQCVNDLDMCSNISGVQTSIPSGKHLDNNGHCVDDVNPPPPPPGGGDDGGGGVIPDIIDTVKTGVVDLLGSIGNISNFIKSPTGNILTKFISTLGVLFGIFSLTDIGLNLLRLWSFFLYGMGFKKRNRPWGVVYDSITKQPLDPAYVVLNDTEGREIGSSITDLDGRYGFLVSPGVYRIVANKTNYTYPSTKLAGRTSDELYNDLYFGELIEVKENEEVISKNIPLDPIGFDWNEFAKKEQKRMKFYHTRDVLLARFSDFMFFLGLVISFIVLFVVPRPYNVIIFCLYIVLLLVRRTTIRRSRKGRVVYKADNSPISYGILRVKSMESGQEIAHRVLDKTGNYFCLIPNGVYNVSIEKKNDDSSYTNIFNSDNFEIKKGILKKNFRI